MAKKRGYINTILIAAIILLVLVIGLFSIFNVIKTEPNVTSNSVFDFGWLKNLVKITGFVAYDAQCATVGNTLPATMTAGETRSVTVPMINKGTNTWNAANSYRLGSTTPDNNWVWGLARVAMASGANIVTNQQYSFTFSIKAPTTPGTYTSNWRMVK